MTRRSRVLAVEAAEPVQRAGPAIVRRSSARSVRVRRLVVSASSAVVKGAAFHCLTCPQVRLIGAGWGRRA